MALNAIVQWSLIGSGSLKSANLCVDYTLRTLPGCWCHGFQFTFSNRSLYHVFSRTIDFSTNQFFAPPPHLLDAPSSSLGCPLIDDSLRLFINAPRWKKIFVRKDFSLRPIKIIFISSSDDWDLCHTTSLLFNLVRFVWRANCKFILASCLLSFAPWHYLSCVAKQERSHA